MRLKNKRLFTVILICVFVLLLPCLLETRNDIYLQQEYFVPQLSYVVDEKKDVLEINIDSHVLTNTTLSIGNVSKNIKIAPHNAEYTCKITDAFSIIHYSNPNTLFVSAFANENACLVIISPVTNIKSWTSEPYIIGYTNHIEKDILTIVTNSLAINHKISLKQCMKNDSIDETIFNTNGLDALCCFANVKTMKIKKDFKFQMIDYADIVDMKKLAIMVPYALRTVYDFSLFFQQLKGKRAVLKSVISFDTIIVAKPNLLEMNVSRDIYKILIALNTPTKINFYQMFIPALPISLEYAKSHDTFIQKRDKLQILEQFHQEVSLPVIRANMIINGFFDMNNKTFSFKGTSIDDIEITEGMNVILQHQHRPYENGSYTVDKIEAGQTILRQQESSSTQQDNDYSFVCYGDNSIKSKGLCESPFNELGVLKSKQTTWDKPCTVDTECPFFQANRNYKNYRGGCINGRCEMPIGAQAIGFRKYDPNSSVSCHGCINTNTTFCCKEQLNSNIYPYLKSPDYAFEIDYFERLNK